MDACDAWLRDVEDPRRYDLGPRSEEVQVTYLAPGADGKASVRRRAPLSSLLKAVEDGGFEVIHSETRIADPRELILATARELRQTVGRGVELARELTEQQIEFVQACLEADEDLVEPEVGKVIVKTARSRLDLLEFEKGAGSETEAPGSQVVRRG